jgi:hypothetical protein
MTVMPRLAALALFSTAGALAADFLPLKEGNTWTYRDASTGRSFTIKTGTQFYIDGRVYYSLAGYADSSATAPKLPVRIDERGDLVYFDEEKYVERVLTSFTPFERGWWEAPARMCAEEGQTLEKPVAYDGPVGSFAEALQIRYRNLGCADAGVESEVFLANVGMVRRVEQSIAGPRQYDLTYAKIGNMVVDATRKARFTVSLDYPAQSEDVVVTLRLESDPIVPLKLKFNSGQEYEVQIVGESGRKLWTWSAGQAFIQALHERTVTGGWTITVTAPRSALLAESAVTVKGWLTTSEDSPQFAATVPVGPEPAVQPAATTASPRAASVSRRE